MADFLDSMHAAITLKDIDIKSELASRPFRPPDYETENRALVRLAQEMAERPSNLLQLVANLALELCHAGSAGISLLETQNGQGIFPLGSRGRFIFDPSQ